MAEEKNCFLYSLRKFKDNSLLIAKFIFWTGISIFSITSFITSIIFLQIQFGEKAELAIKLSLYLWKYWCVSLGIFAGVFGGLYILYNLLNWYFPKLKKAQEKKINEFFGRMKKTFEESKSGGNRRTTKNSR